VTPPTAKIAPRSAALRVLDVDVIGFGAINVPPPTLIAVEIRQGIAVNDTL